MPDKINPSLAEATVAAIERVCSRMYTNAVGEIISFDPVHRKAKIRLIGKVQYGEHVLEYPTISGVPVWSFGGGDFYINTPVKKGDFVLVSFARRSIDEWKQKGEKSTKPKSKRKFDIEDAIALPKLFSFSAPPENYDEDAIVIWQNSTTNPWKVRVSSSGVSIGNDDYTLEIRSDKIVLSDGASAVLSIEGGLLKIESSAKSLLQILIDVCVALSTHTHTDSLAGTTSVPLNAASFISAQSDISAMKAP